MPIFGAIASSTRQGLPNNSYFSLATTLVSSGGSSVVEFTSIPSTYKHLQIRMHARASVNAHVTTFIRFNGNSSNLYSGAEFYGTASGLIDSGQTVGENQITYGPFQPGGSQATGIFGFAVMDIYEYANTSMNKTILGWNGYENNSSAFSPSASHLLLRCGTWNNTAAISSISLTPSSGVWAEHSRFSLYGIKGA